MFESKCSYCTQTENLSYQSVSRLFGILHCANHVSQALEDLHIYMHTHEIVKYQDACTHPHTRPLFDILHKGVAILRSTGEWEEGWKPHNDPVGTLNILQKFDNEWYYLFSKPTDDTDLVKAVALTSLFREESKAMPLLQTAVQALNEGIYQENNPTPP